MSDSNKLDPPWEYRRSYYAAVGQTISFWTNMESRLVEIAAILLDTTREKTGLILYSVMSFHTWLNIVDDLFGLDPKHLERRATWTKISADLRSMNDTRVRLAHHSIWHSFAKGGGFGLSPSPFDMRPKARGYSPLSIDELDKFAAEIEALQKRLDDLMLEMLNQVESAGALARLLATSAPPKDGQPEADAPPLLTAATPPTQPRPSEE